MFLTITSRIIFIITEYVSFFVISRLRKLNTSFQLLVERQQITKTARNDSNSLMVFHA